MLNSFNVTNGNETNNLLEHLTSPTYSYNKELFRNCETKVGDRLLSTRLDALFVLINVLLVAFLLFPFLTLVFRFIDTEKKTDDI